MALLVALAIVGVLVLLRRLGFWPDVPPSWNLFWRIFLNVLWVLGVAAVVAKAWSIAVVAGHLDPRLLVSPSRDPFIDGISTAFLALALYGVWERRKWGAYLIFVRLVLTICIQVFVYHSLQWHLVRHYTGAQNLAADFVGVAMWLLAFNRTWDMFA